MEKQTPLEFAHEFINDLTTTPNSFNLSNELEVCFNQNILSDDPNLTILKSELKKANFDLIPTNDKHNFIVKKLS
ncbi:MAG: hypothetical protein IJ008_03540 [Clostridia bacterium]|nr:hypothetical protein [Clostridia bacterium]